MSELPVAFQSQKEQIIGVLHLPKQHNCPTVIICHGMFGSKSYPHLVKLARNLADAGFAALRFDFRGLGDSQGTTEDYTYAKEVEDVRSALDFLSTIPQVNTDRIGILGHSRGGTVSILSASKDTRIKALVTWNSPAYPKLMWSEEEVNEIYETPYVLVRGYKVTYKTWEDNRDIDIISALQEVNVPSLFIAGTSDTEVDPKIHSEAFYRHANEPKELKWIEGADHMFSNLDHLDEAINYTISWYKNKLEPH